MPLNVWTQSSGYSLGTFQERVKFSQILPVTGDTGVTYRVISGQLPPGLRLEGRTLLGTPYEVPRSTNFRFCIRASNNNEISDRTFVITIEGADPPTFITPAGSLNIGDAQQYFTLDSSFIDYQIEAFDLDIAVGQRLSYFIASGDGELPPGLVLTEDGRIVGFVQPVLSIRPEDGSGEFDNGLYDSAAYDFAYKPTNGYDSYVYDTVTFDYSLPSLRPRKLNRNYEFIVTLTDGDSIVKRKFKIFVVGDDYFRADNTTWLDGSGLFTADVTYLRAPIWITRSDLGLYRANNYLTLILDTYNATSSGPVVYSIDNVNNLPPGLTFDQDTSELYGRVPYQPAITKTYTFTITATRFGTNNDAATTPRTFTIQIIGEVDSVINWVTDSNLGSINANFISNLRIEANSTISTAVLLYTVTSGYLPPGLTLDLDGEIVGKVNQYGEIENSGLTRIFDIVNGQRRYSTIDGGTTTFDRQYIFTVQAKDQYGYSAISKEFILLVDTPNEVIYSNIITRPFLKASQRLAWNDFINNTQIFTPGSIYRTNDPNFGVQADLAMLVYAGIQTKESAAYISAMGLNHKRKRFQFGSVSKAYAIKLGTKEIVYEVVYVEMVDPLEPNGKRLPNKLINIGLQTTNITSDSSTSIWSRKLSDLSVDAPRADRPDPIVTTDSTGYQASNPRPGTFFPSSISNWQDRLEAVGLTERNYLPLWMRSIQPGTKQELGFTLAVPLCFCKPGTADDIILNIKYSGFDFKVLDYTADRYIIDAVEGSSGDKYLVFRNDRITV